MSATRGGGGLPTPVALTLFGWSVILALPAVAMLAVAVPVVAAVGPGRKRRR